MAGTYEAVFTGVEEDHVAALKDLPEFARVGGYPQRPSEYGLSEAPCRHGC